MILALFSQTNPLYQLCWTFFQLTRRKISNLKKNTYLNQCLVRSKVWQMFTERQQI